MATIQQQYKKSSSSSSSSSSDDQQARYYQGQTIAYQPTQYQAQQQVVYQPQVLQSGYAQTSQLQQVSSLPAGVTEEQVRRSLAGVSLDVIKGEVRQEYIPMTRVETEYKEEVQYEQVPRQVKVTDYYQVEIQEERIPQVYQHTYTEYVPQQKIIPIVQYKAMEKTYTRPEIMSGDVRVEQGQAEIISSQIIATESNAQATVGFPQVAASGVQVTQVQAPMQSYQTASYVQQKRKTSSFKYQPAVQYQQQRSFAAVPYQTIQQPQMIAQTQMIAQPQVQRMQYAAVPSINYQTQVMPQQTFVQQQQQPGMVIGGQQFLGQSNFQGVRLADSHILAK